MQREWVPVFATQDYGPEQVAIRYRHYTSGNAEGFVTAYRDILKAAPEAYGKIFRHLAQPEPSPCLVHCTAGKDRTGVLVALLFMLVGVPKESISMEYSLTDQGLAPLKPLFVERLLKNPALQGNRDGVLNMVSSKRENMDGTVDMILEEHKSAEEYMRTHCKMSDEEIEQLKKNLQKA
jgi:protein tyrosine/serine phosphatase